MKQLLSEHRWASTKSEPLPSCKSESIAACVGCVYSFDLPREWQNRSYMQVCEQNAAGIGLIFLPASPCGRCGPCDRHSVKPEAKSEPARVEEEPSRRLERVMMMMMMAGRSKCTESRHEEQHRQNCNRQKMKTVQHEHP